MPQQTVPLSSWSKLGNMSPGPIIAQWRGMRFPWVCRASFFLLNVLEMNATVYVLNVKERTPLHKQWMASATPRGRFEHYVWIFCSHLNIFKIRIVQFCFHHEWFMMVPSLQEVVTGWPFTKIEIVNMSCVPQFRWESQDFISDCAKLEGLWASWLRSLELQVWS